MSWMILYRQHQITGLNNCSACAVKFSTKEFEWEILCPSVHSAKIRISKHLTHLRMLELAEQYKLREATK